MEEATGLTRRRYDRVAPVYDLLEAVMELRFRVWRRQLWRRGHGQRILELGVGTGKNLRLHPRDATVIAIDISRGMLERARRRSRRLGSQAQLALADAQRLPLADGTMDVVVASFVFCSVPDATRGLSEARRVLRPGGRLLLLEHVLSKRPLLRWMMRRLDRLTVRIWGAHIDRSTGESVRRAGFTHVEETALALDIVKLIEARGPELDERQPKNLLRADASEGGLE